MTDTLFNRAVNLLQKSRKAVGMYKSLNYSGKEPLTELKRQQARIWVEVSTELSESLNDILSVKDKSKLSNNLKELCAFHLGMINKFSKSQIKLSQELTGACERKDFVKCSLLSYELVQVKSKLQACEAAASELEKVVGESVELPKEEVKLAKVIQLRKFGS